MLAFDSDEAGTKAALRSDELESPFRLDLDLRVAVMPDGLDPADLVQTDRSDELVEAVQSARPLLEHRIEHEVARFDLEGPEGRARALHATASQLGRVSDEIARSEYERFVSRLIGVDLETVQRAVRPARQRYGDEGEEGQRPLDRAESELLRVVLANPAGRGDVNQGDFSDERLRRAFVAVEGQLTEVAPGTPLDVSRVEDSEALSILRSLVMDGRPLPDWSDLEKRLKGKRLDMEIAELEKRLESLDDDREAHSNALRHLIALQKEKKALGAS